MTATCTTWAMRILTSPRWCTLMATPLSGTFTALMGHSPSTMAAGRIFAVPRATPLSILIRVGDWMARRDCTTTGIVCTTANWGGLGVGIRLVTPTALACGSMSGIRPPITPILQVSKPLRTWRTIPRTGFLCLRLAVFRGLCLGTHRMFGSHFMHLAWKKVIHVTRRGPRFIPKGHTGGRLIHFPAGPTSTFGAKAKRPVLRITLLLVPTSRMNTMADRQLTRYSIIRST